MKSNGTIRITCRGADTAALEDLKRLQGNLKTLSDENYEKLKTSLLKHGFSFPFFVWRKGRQGEGETRRQGDRKNGAGRSPGLQRSMSPNLYILDGHQRDRALARLRDAGYKIPPLPVIYVDAANEKEAREKILVLSSQYGEMTDDSLMEFLKESDLKLEDLMAELRLPEIDLDALLKDIENGDEKKQETMTHEVIVTCRGPKEQKGLLASLKKQGYKCRALST